MNMIELERTFLAKKIPKNLRSYQFFEILDIYLPESNPHPKLRIRKIGKSRFEITKKYPLKGNDSSEQKEETIKLNEEEFNELARLSKKRIRKKRFYYKNAEIDIFLDKLKGLVLVDFEFKTKKEKQAFSMPDFCLVDITQEKHTAAGAMAGKKYSQIEPFLKKYGYTKLSVSF